MKTVSKRFREVYLLQYLGFHEINELNFEMFSRDIFTTIPRTPSYSGRKTGHWPYRWQPVTSVNKER